MPRGPYPQVEDLEEAFDQLHGALSSGIKSAQQAVTEYTDRAASMVAVRAQVAALALDTSAFTEAAEGLASSKLDRRHAEFAAGVAQALRDTSRETQSAIDSALATCDRVKSVSDAVAEQTRIIVDLLRNLQHGATSISSDLHHAARAHQLFEVPRTVDRAKSWAEAQNLEIYRPTGGPSLSDTTKGLLAGATPSLHLTDTLIATEGAIELVDTIRKLSGPLADLVRKELES